MSVAKVFITLFSIAIAVIFGIAGVGIFTALKFGAFSWLGAWFIVRSRAPWIL